MFPKIPVWVSGTGVGHVTLDCAGLDLMRLRGLDPADSFTREVAPSLRTVFHPDAKQANPCRVCAAEPLVAELSSVTKPTGPAVMFMTGLYRAVAPTVSRRSKGAEPVRSPESEQQWAQRVAALLEAQVVRGPRGLWLYGLAPRSLVAALATYFQVVVDQTYTTLPSVDLIVTFLSLRAEGAFDDAVAWEAAHNLFLEP